MTKSIKNINYFKDQYMDLFLPDKEEFFTIIHFHGGGLIEGDKGDTHNYVKHLTKYGFAVSTANYPLLPDNKFPSFLYSASEAVRWVKDHISQYGKSKGLIISGQSAGAYITLMLCFNHEYLDSVGISNQEITAWISDSSQTTTHFNILKLERGLSPLLQRIDEAAPLYYINENTSFNHLLLLTYEDDMPNRLEQNKLLLTTIKNFNPSLDVSLKSLKKWHCHGSSEVDADGEYEAIKVIVDYFTNIKK